MKGSVILTGKQKRALRALGHHLRPLLSVGKNGTPDPVIAQLEADLLAHELVKVKVLKSCPQMLGDVAATLSESTGAALAQSVGRTLLLYRAHPEEPVIRLPG